MRIAARLLLLVLSLALGVGIVEAMLRSAYHSERGPGAWQRAPGSNSPYVHIPVPGLGDINERSMRRPAEVSAQPADGVFRVLSYGDSIAHGFGIAQSETYAHGLESELSASSGRPVEVLNMFRGHSPTIHSFHIRNDVPRLAPNAVVLAIELLNDVPDEALIETRGEGAYGLPEEIVRARYAVGFDGHLFSHRARADAPLSEWIVFAKVSNWLSRQHAKFADNPTFGPRADTAWYALSTDRHLLTQESLDRGFIRLFDSIVAVRRFLLAQDVEFLLVIVPSRDVYRQDAFALGAERILRRAEEQAEALGLPFLSLRDAMTEGGADLYMDFCHPTAAGNAAITEALREPMAAWLSK